MLSQSVKIGLIKDGPSQKNFLSEQQVKKEILELLGEEFDTQFVSSEQIMGDWTIQGINQVINKAYQDKSIDILVTLGGISSNEIAKRQHFPKPTIVAVTIDAAAQKLPFSNNRSGKNNFTYIADVKEAGYEILFFKNFVGQRKFAVLVEPLLAESWPELSELLKKAEDSFDVEFMTIPVDRKPSLVVSKIPAGVEAVVVGILSQYSEQESKQLASELIQRKLPSYSFIGEKGVENGFLVSSNQMSQAREQIARRIAINIQRILLGTNAKNLPVNMHFNSRVVYNQATGLAIGFAPKWADIIDAKVLNQESNDNLRAFTIRQAMAFAIKNNLDLNVSSIDVELANKDVRLAKSNLYPGLSLGTGYTQIKKEQVLAGVNPEKRLDSQLNFSQLVFSESAWANYDISKLLVTNQDALYQSKLLDTMQQTATAYLNLLRQKSDEEIRIFNLEVTRKNLELAENRLKIGASGKSDVLRWKSQLAADRKNLFVSEANLKNAELELARIMNLPKNFLVDVTEPQVSDLLNMLTEQKFQKFVANKIYWQVFQEFYKQESLINSPELKSFDSQLNIKQREYLANQRGYYIPDINLTAQAGRVLDQSGLGAVSNLEKDSWTVGVQATLSFDLNGQRRTTGSKKQLEQQQLLLQRESVKQKITTNTAQALFNIGSSYPSIELTQISSDAALESLDLVRDSYAKGTVSISDLLDAQNNALSAKLLAADAEYSFLQDYIILMRAVGDFKPLLDGQYSNQWFDRLIKYFHHKGINVGVE